jgi:hypothetical protein
MPESLSGPLRRAEASALNMSWVRRNLRIGSHLALFALAIQLVLSFSHVHLDGLNLAPRQVVVQAADQPGAPSPEGPSPGHDALCPICLSIQLAGATLQPAPPVLALPEPLEWTPPAATAAFAAAWNTSSFNARAPPLA